MAKQKDAIKTSTLPATQASVQVDDAFIAKLTALFKSEDSNSIRIALAISRLIVKYKPNGRAV